MLLNYKFQNCFSFRDNVEFSLLAPKSKVKGRFPDNYVKMENGCEVLKTAVIVGENAGGKSNFVNSLEYFKSFFQDVEKVRAFKSVVNANNYFDNCPKKSDTCQIFEIEVLWNTEIMYCYHFEVDFFGIVKEYFAYKNKYSEKYKSLFDVTRKSCRIHCENETESGNCKNCSGDFDVEFNVSVSEMDRSLRDSLVKVLQNKNNLGLFITKLALLGNEHAMRFTEWVSLSLCPESYSIGADLYRAFKNEEDDMRILKDPGFIDIFRMIDYSIIGIEIDEENPFTKTVVRRKKTDGTELVRELGQDSGGVREFFAWAVQVFKVVYENKTVFADEMDRVLNPVLSDRVIAFIHGKKHQGQFIFTSHNVLHLDLRTYMKEQIYFVTKDIESLESELYALSDFPEIRYETAKIYEFYMKGILGGTAVE